MEVSMVVLWFLNLVGMVSPHSQGIMLNLKMSYLLEVNFSVTATGGKQTSVHFSIHYSYPFLFAKKKTKDNNLANGMLKKNQTIKSLWHRIAFHTIL